MAEPERPDVPPIVRLGRAHIVGTTALVLAIGVVSALSKPGIFWLGSLLGEYRWLFYLFSTVFSLAAFTVSLQVSLVALILGWRTLQWRAACPALAGIIALFAWFTSMGPPSDSTLEKHFSRYEARFEKLTVMAMDEDPGFVVFSYWTPHREGNRCSDPEAIICLPEERWHEYLRQFRTLGLPSGLYHYEKRKWCRYQ